MHYYQHNIDDFNAATAHLTHVERSLYFGAIHLYYKLEKPLETDFARLSRRLMARSDEEKQALRYVLDEFFALTDEGYINDRCEEEITNYRNTKTDKSMAGQISAITKKINNLKAVHTKEIKDFVAQKDKEKAQESLNRCLTGVANLLAKCSTDVQQTFNRKGTEGQLTKELNKLITNNKKNNTKKITLDEYREQCKTDGVKAIPDDCIVFKNAEDLNLPSEMVLAAWECFCDHWTDNTKSNAKKIDWLKAFNNCIKDDGYGAYKRNRDGEFYLTTKGQNALALAAEVCA